MLTLHTESYADVVCEKCKVALLYESTDERFIIRQIKKRGWSVKKAKGDTPGTVNYECLCEICKKEK